jgi:type II secretion system protein I
MSVSSSAADFFHCLPARDGFTLLEVMVAVAIIAISFVSLIGSQSQSIAVAEVSRFEITASLLARRQLALLETGAFDDIQSGQGDFGDQFEAFSWEAEVDDLSEDDTGIPGSADMLKVVDLTVRRGNDENMVFRVRSVFMRPIQAEKK